MCPYSFYRHSTYTKTITVPAQEFNFIQLQMSKSRCTSQIGRSICLSLAANRSPSLHWFEATGRPHRSRCHWCPTGPTSSHQQRPCLLGSLATTGHFWSLFAGSKMFKPFFVRQKNETNKQNITLTTKLQPLQP